MCLLPEDGIVFTMPGHGGHRDSTGVALELDVLPSAHNNRPHKEHDTRLLQQSTNIMWQAIFSVKYYNNTYNFWVFKPYEFLCVATTHL